jgi:GTP cyclohydrolase II
MAQSMQTVWELASAPLPTRRGGAQIHVFDSKPHGEGEVVVLSRRAPGTPDATIPLVRLHSVCLTGDVLGSLKCDCGGQLQTSLTQIMTADFGVLVYVLNHEGRGIGLANKIRAYSLQSLGADTVQANVALCMPVDARDYRPCAEVLIHLGICRVRLLTNNPDKLEALEAAGIEVVERVSLLGFENPFNQEYLDTKEQVMGHLPEVIAAAAVSVIAAEAVSS